MFRLLRNELKRFLKRVAVHHEVSRVQLPVGCQRAVLCHLLRVQEKGHFAFAVSVPVFAVGGMKDGHAAQM